MRRGCWLGWFVVGIWGCTGAPDPQRLENGVTTDALRVAAPVSLEMGATAVSSTEWTRVELEGTFAAPVVVATPQYTAASPPLVTRVRNAAGNAFEVTVQRLDNGTGVKH